jgi:hypothetical protein
LGIVKKEREEKMAKIRMSKSLVALALALAAAAVGPGVADAAEIRPLVKAGFDFGGDSTVRVLFTNGDTRTIKANEGLYLGGGAAVINDARETGSSMSRWPTSSRSSTLPTAT